MSEPYIGQIQMVGFGFAPRGWTACDGQVLPISQNTALFSLLGTTFGGDGRTTFALPDLRGRDAVHVGQGAGLSQIRWGQKGGMETTTLNTANLPAHSHSFAQPANTSDGASSDPEDNYPAAHTGAYLGSPESGVSLGGGTTSNVGNSQSFNHRDPYLGIWHIIALTGIFPSRN